ncbi:sigma-70 family RNA polymerase sigma factor [Dongia sp.]|uniref:sigma-70 family RNA polymerase sigma factor n=1 Tax=Dongia sp. TaxID=1977262 RepID=UPI0035B1C22E
MENAPILPSLSASLGILETGWIGGDAAKAAENGVRIGAKRPKKKAAGGTGSAVARMNLSEARPDNGAERMTGFLTVLKEAPDESAFAELFRYYAPRLKSYMRKLGAAEDQAEELAQEAMATVWRKAHLFDADKAGAGTWIFSIARNLRIDAFRRRKRPEIEFDDPTLVPDDPASPEAMLDHGQQARAVRAALAALPREQATIVHLSFFEDKPHAEIAAELGIPLGTVKSRMRLAFQRFRKALGEPRS